MTVASVISAYDGDPKIYNYSSYVTAIISI